MITGIYTITSPSGKQYVGCAKHVPTRWSGHRSLMRRGIHTNRMLQRAWDRYGESGMIFSIIELCREGELLEREQAAMDMLKPRYNIAKFAGRNTGLRHTDEAKRKIGSAAKRKFTDEHRAKISAARKGMKFSDQHKENISKATKGRTKRQPAGQTRSPERRAAISAKMRGVAKSPEAKANMLAARHARMFRERAAKADALAGNQQGAIKRHD